MTNLAELLTDPDVLTKFNIEYLTADIILVRYDTLAGNKPNTYRNTIHLWQKEGWEIPSDDPNIIKDPKITGDESSNTQLFSDVGMSGANHLIAYAVGESAKTIVTTQRLEPLSGGQYKVIP